MRIIIIGGVAAGTSAGAKARRNDESAEIVIYDKDTDISYSGCGLPYYIGDDSITREQIVPRTPSFFKKKYNIDVLTEHEVKMICPRGKYVEVRDIKSNKIFRDKYDKLVIATGASSFVPAIEGLNSDNHFVLRNVKSADRIRNYIKREKPETAVIIGTGFIGLEMAEAFTKRGIKVTLVEIEDRVMPSLDKDMSVHLREYLESKGLKIVTGVKPVGVRGFIGDSELVLDNKEIIQTDIILVAAGIRPRTELAKKAQIEIGKTGAIKVDSKMRTSNPDIFACGDCAESFFLLDSTPIYRPLGSTANKMGRITGESLFDKGLSFRGILGTGIFKVFDMAVAQTGLTESRAKEKSIDVAVCHNIKPDKTGYMGGTDMIIKGIANRKTGKLIGVQIIGEEGVDKRIDVFATAISLGAKVSDLFHLDLAYAPPFSTAKDPVMYTGMILENHIYNNRKLITVDDLSKEIFEGKEIRILDTRIEKQFENGHISDALSIPHECLRNECEKLPRDVTMVTYCNKGVTGNATQNILIGKGFENVYNLSGGYNFWKKTKENK